LTLDALSGVRPHGSSTPIKTNRAGRMSRNDPKARMLDKARALFWKKGYGVATMRDIARAYGCKPSNIYNYFSTKEEILFEVLREEMEHLLRPIRHLEHESGSDARDQLSQLIRSHLRLNLSYRRSGKLLFDVALDHLSPSRRKEIVAMRDHYDRIIRGVIRRGIEQGRFRPVDEKLTGMMIASMITRTRMWFHPKKGVSVEELAEFISDFVLNGLCVPTGSGR